MRSIPKKTLLSRNSVMRRIYNMVKSNDVQTGNVRNAHRACANYIRRAPTSNNYLALIGRNDRVIHSCIVDADGKIIEDTHMDASPRIVMGHYHSTIPQLNDARILVHVRVRNVFAFATAYEQARNTGTGARVVAVASGMYLLKEDGDFGTRIISEQGQIAVITGSPYSPCKHSITDFYVHEALRGKGNGTALLREVIRKYKDNICGQVSSIGSLRIMYKAGFRAKDCRTLAATETAFRENAGSLLLVYRRKRG